MSDSNELERQVNETFDAFRQSLESMLAAEARDRVDSTLQRLKSASGPFQIEDVHVEVVIRDLKLVSTAPAAGTDRAPAPATRRKRSAAKPPTRRTRSSPARGSVREAILAAMAEGDEVFSTEQLRNRLEAQGVETTADNFHQQLGRLVKAGRLERAGRGRYRRANSTAA